MFYDFSKERTFVDRKHISNRAPIWKKIFDRRLYKISRFVWNVWMHSNANKTIGIHYDIWNLQFNWQQLGCDVVTTTAYYISDILQICVFAVELVYFLERLDLWSPTNFLSLKILENVPLDFNVKRTFAAVTCERDTLWFVTNTATSNIFKFTIN